MSTAPLIRIQQHSQSVVVYLFNNHCELDHPQLPAIISYMMMNTPPPKPHLLVVPFPAQGHMLALLDLAALLTTRGGDDLSVTVAVTAGNTPLLEPLLAACPSVGVVTLAFPSSSPLLPLGCAVENTRDLPLHLFRMFIPALAALRAPLLSWCKAQAQRHRRVTAIVSDLFTGWTGPLAAEIGARQVAFSPSSAFYVAISRPLWRDMPQRPPPRAEADDEDGEAVVTFHDVIGAPSFPWHRMTSLYRHHEVGDEPSEMIRQILLWSLASDCIVVNSFAAFEPAYLDDDRRVLARAPRVLAVGPLSEARATDSGNRGGKPAVAPSEVAAWLDAFADGSVVYVNFGTQHALSSEQAACVAEALAQSSAAFVWAVGTLTVVPDGFEAATASRGMVIRGWAPQVEILRHRAVGWFLMHCGMNAVLEAASAGVAMLAWPMGADHFVNRILIQEAGVAMEVAEGADTVPDAGRMAKAIAVAIGDEGKAIRERAMELSRKAAAAVANGGSSYMDFQELVDLLSKVD